MEDVDPGSYQAAYRVKKISVRRGWAIDQIKFEYDDGKTWSVGIDGGRKDNRDFIMTPGEYLVRVTHETLRQRSVQPFSSAKLYDTLLLDGTLEHQWSLRPTRGE